MQLKLNGPKELPKLTVLEQTPERIYSRQEYSNGWILVTDMRSDGTADIKSNFNWIQEPDGSMSPDYNSPNRDFIDPINQ